MNQTTEQQRHEFRKELEALINRHSMENGSDTPDMILALYLTDCLAAFDRATGLREVWYGRGNQPTELDHDNNHPHR